MGVAIASAAARVKGDARTIVVASFLRQEDVFCLHMLRSRLCALREWRGLRAHDAAQGSRNRRPRDGARSSSARS